MIRVSVHSAPSSYTSATKILRVKRPSACSHLCYTIRKQLKTNITTVSYVRIILQIDKTILSIVFTNFNIFKCMTIFLHLCFNFCFDFVSRLVALCRRRQQGAHSWLVDTMASGQGTRGHVTVSCSNNSFVVEDGRHLMFTLLNHTTARVKLNSEIGQSSWSKLQVLSLIVESLNVIELS